MPKGPRGEKRPADVIGAAVKVMRIATGQESEEITRAFKSAAAELGSRGGKARAAELSKKKRAGIGRELQTETVPCASDRSELVSLVLKFENAP